MSKVWTTYYDDDNVREWAIQVNAGWIGFPTRPMGLYPPVGDKLLPAGIRMRCFTCVNAAGRHRNIPCQAIGTWRSGIAIGHVFTMPTNDGSTMSWTVIGKIAQSYNPKKYRSHERRN